MRIALDAMGGDNGPHPNLAGAIAALSSDPELDVVLIGDEPQMKDLISQSGYSGERLSVHASEGCVGMEEKPMEALRKKTEFFDCRLLAIDGRG